MASTRDQRGPESATEPVEAKLEGGSEELELLRRALAAQAQELELLRLAHEAQARHLVSERLAFADRIEEGQNDIERLREEVEWRKGVMEEFESQLARIHGSRTFRYTAPIRSLKAALRVRRG